MLMLIIYWAIGANLQQAKKYYEDALTLYHRIYQGQNDPKNIQQKIEKRLHGISKL